MNQIVLSKIVLSKIVLSLLPRIESLSSTAESIVLRLGLIGLSLMLARPALGVQTQPPAATDPQQQLSVPDPAADPAPAPPADSAPAPPAKDWPYFRGDSASTGVARSSLPAELEVVWEFKVQKGAFEGTASIVTDPDDPTKQLVLIGDLDGKLFAIDLQSGEQVWEFATEIGFGTTPVVRDGKIFIGNLDGVFYCLDFKGQELWRFQANGEINSSANFFEENVLFGSQDACLYAVNRETGKLSWKYESQDQIRCSITVAGDRAFVAGCDGFFHIVKLQDGTAAGKVEIHSPTGSTPAAVGSMVYFGNQAGEFFAIDVQKVETAWVLPAINDGDSIVGAAAVSKENLIFGNRNRNVFAIDPRTGTEQWKVTLKSKIDASPVIVDDRVYVASTDGRLYALALKDGSLLWERQFNGGFLSSPAVAFEKLVIATNRGVVYCLGKKSAAAPTAAAQPRTGDR